MAISSELNLSSLIDQRRIGGFQWMVYALCMVCLIVDGFDLQALAFVGPSLIREWKIPNAAMGPVFSAALVGVLFGSLLLSMLADKIGRRPVMIAATICFSVLTYFTGQAASVHSLIMLRFFAGIVLGGIVPNAMALSGEYSPARKRVLIMMLVSSGFTLGAVVGGVVSEWLIPHSGWRSVFTFGALVSLLVAIVMLAFLPESLPFLALTGKSSAMRRYIRHLAPEISADASLSIAGEPEAKGVPLGHLFRDGRALVTVLLWVVNFMNLLNLYFLTNWLPTAVRSFGFSNQMAIRAGTITQLGGLVGGILLGLFAQRLGLVRVLTICFLVACLCFGVISRSSLPFGLLLAVVFLAGFCIPGGQVGINALAATYYPTTLRSTGIGAGLGVGRIGAILGPLIAGELLRQHWEVRSLFLAAVLPALLSAVAILSITGVKNTPVLE
jgi:MFS transporter, AAHS family, 4-hydroxybenzoate transporter